MWFADEARIGQKNKITRRWARRGTRPSAPHDQRTASTYIFGAICPAEGKGAGLVLPRCNTAAMNLHLAEIASRCGAGRSRGAAAGSGRVAPVGRARGAGQHHPHAAAAQMSRAEPGRERLAVHARQLALQPRLQVLRRDIVDHCCHAWNKLVDQPWRIMSIGLRDWAHGF